jgi:hypothetical protein
MSVTINGTTGIAGVDGSAGTPSYQGNDSNTGIFFPASDTIAFAEGGVEVARFNSSGNLGVGTTSPGARLAVTEVGGSGTQVLVTGSAGTNIRYDTGRGFANNRNWLVGCDWLNEGQFAIIPSTVLGGGTFSAAGIAIDGSSGNFRFNSGYGSAAIAYGCRAWVNFASNGSVRASGNVSSVTQNGTGDYTINFTNAMPDTSYACALAVRRASSNDVLFANPFGASSGTAFSTGSLRIRTYNSSPVAENPETTTATIFR